MEALLATIVITTVEETNTGPTIAKELTEYKYGRILDDRQAQEMWDSWCIKGKWNAIVTWMELQESGSIDGVEQAEFAAVVS